MAFSRGLGVFGIIGMSWIVAVGCGDDDSTNVQPEAGGEGGEAPKGGTSSVAGSKTGGTAGMSSAGAAGMAAGNGGTSGEATGGSGGEPPVTPNGGAAGDVGASGGAGDAGTSGAGGEAPVALKARQCAYECETNADCIRGTDDSHKCNPVSKRCEDPMTSCSAHADCIPFANFLAPCPLDQPCDSGYDCVTLDAVGYCAPRAHSETGCAGLEGDPLTVAKFGGDGTSTVCVTQFTRCKAGECIYGCGDELFGGGCGQVPAGPGTGDSCNLETGLCECAQSNECNAGLSVCGGDSHCGCAADSECTVAGRSVCVAGTCGCATAGDCPSAGYASAPARCE